MGWRFLFDRAVAGTLALGFAVPLNLPYAVQASQIADSANVDTPVRPVAAGGSAQSGGVEQPGSANPHLKARLLRIGAQGELPCDSGEWATSGLFGPHAALAEALGVDPAGISNGAHDVALAAALGDRPAAGNADFSAFGSIFDNSYHPLTGGGPGGLFAATGGTGGGPTGGSGTDTGGGGPFTGGGPTSGGGTDIGGGGPLTGGGPTGGGTDTGGGGPSTGGGPGVIGGGPIGGGGTDIGGDNPLADGGPGPTGSIGPGDDIFTNGPGPAGGPEGASDGTTLPGGGDGNTGDHSAGPFGPVQQSIPAAVPEPSSWATMLLGFCLIGGAMRARRGKARLAYAPRGRPLAVRLRLD